MKKPLLTAALLALSTTFIFADMPRFSDVKAADWYSATVTELTARGGITGYDDGTFRPGGTITRAEYTAIVARSLGVKAKEGAGGHWASGLMIAAQEAGLVKAWEFPELDKPITRNEMARMAVRALGYQKEPVPADYRDYEPLIADLAGTGAFREDVAKVVALGIITGYPDKTFQGTKTLTRAEASAVVVRILEKEARKVPVKPSAVGVIKLGETKPIEEFVSNMPVFNEINAGLKTVTLVTPESLGMSRYPRQAPYKDDIWLAGRGDRMAVIKDGKTVVIVIPTYAASINQTLYDGRHFGAEIGEIDYFGFFDGKWGAEPTKMDIVKNPWKE